MLNGYKTYIVAGIQIFTGVLAATDWVAFLANPKVGLTLIGSGVLAAGMRWITSQTTLKA